LRQQEQPVILYPNNVIAILKMKSQTDNITRTPNGQTNFGDMGESGNLLPTQMDAMPTRPILPSVKCMCKVALIKKCVKPLLFFTIKSHYKKSLTGYFF